MPSHRCLDACRQAKRGEMRWFVGLLAVALLCAAPSGAAPPNAGDGEAYDDFLHMLRQASWRDTFQDTRLAQVAEEPLEIMPVAERAEPAETAPREETIQTLDDAAPGKTAETFMEAQHVTPLLESILDELPGATREFKPYLPPTGDALEKSEQAETPEEQLARLMRERLRDFNITLNFKDAELENIIRLIARVGELNVVIPPKIVQGTVTVYLEDVPILVAFDSVLRANGLTYLIEQSGILRIIPLERVEKTDQLLMETVHVPLNWIRAARLQEVLEPILEQTEGQVTAIEDTNSVVIVATPPTIAQLRELIRKVDIPDKQVDIEARFYELSDEASRGLGLSWAVLHNPAIDAAGPGPSDATVGMNAFTDTAFTLGGLWQYARIFDIDGEAYRLDAAISAYENRSEAEILANPRVTTLNNVPADINLTDEIPYQDAQVDDAGQLQIIWRFQPTGITMTVTPIITNNGYVKMNIEAQQIIQRGEAPYGSPPPTSTRSSNTNVIVEDEATAGLFGLRDLQARNATDGVPWLHRVPFFGWLFKDKSYGHTRRNLALFITPHIVKDPNLTYEEMEQYGRIDEKWDLPHYFFDDVALPMDK